MTALTRFLSTGVCGLFGILSSSSHADTGWEAAAYRATTAAAALSLEGSKVTDVDIETTRFTAGRFFGAQSGRGARVAIAYSHDRIGGTAPLSRPVGADLPERGFYTPSLDVTVRDTLNSVSASPRLRSATNDSRSVDEVQLEAFYIRRISERLGVGIGYTTIFGRHLVTPIVEWQWRGISARLPVEAQWRTRLGQRVSGAVVVQQVGGGIYRGSDEVKDYRLRNTSVGGSIEIEVSKGIHIGMETGVLLLRRFDVQLDSGEHVDRDFDEALYSGFHILFR